MLSVYLEIPWRTIFMKVAYISDFSYVQSEVITYNDIVKDHVSSTSLAFSYWTPPENKSLWSEIVLQFEQIIAATVRGMSIDEKWSLPNMNAYNTTTDASVLITFKE